MTQPTAPDLCVEDYGDTFLAQETVHSCWMCADQRLGGGDIPGQLCLVHAARFDNAGGAV